MDVCRSCAEYDSEAHRTVNMAVHGMMHHDA